MLLADPEQELQTELTKLAPGEGSLSFCPFDSAAPAKTESMKTPGPQAKKP